MIYLYYIIYDLFKSDIIMLDWIIFVIYNIVYLNLKRNEQFNIILVELIKSF